MQFTQKRYPRKRRKCFVRNFKARRILYKRGPLQENGSISDLRSYKKRLKSLQNSCVIIHNTKYMLHPSIAALELLLWRLKFS